MAKNNINSCIVYHGSEFRIDRPVFGLGKAHNDYGLGFYCTEKIEMAKEWAVTEAHDGYANKYELNLEGLKVLNLAKAPYNTLHWLSVLVKYRVFDMGGGIIASAAKYLNEHFSVDVEEYDVVIGYRADDNYFSFARGFLNGTISYEQLCRAIRLGGLGLQTVLKSPKAFDQIKSIDFERAFRADWLKTRRERENRAREAFGEILRRGFKVDELYMINILQQGILPDDARL